MEDKATFDAKLPTPPQAPEIPRPESDKRKDAIDSLKAQIKSASAKDKSALDKAISLMEDAQKGMTDLENNIESVDAALASETDPDAKSALADLVDTIDSTYADLDKQFKDAEKTVKDWASKQNYSLDSIADTIAAIKARGEKVNPLLDNWQKKIDSKKSAAMRTLKSKFNLTAAEEKAAEGIFKKNCKALYDAILKGEITFATLTEPQDIIHMLNETYPAGADGNAGFYRGIVTGSFGYNGSCSAKEGSLCFCRLIEGSPKEYKDWSWNDDCAIVPNPKKSVIAFFPALMNGASKYGSGNSDAAASLLTDASLVSATGQYCSRDAITKDLTKLPGKKLLQAMGFDHGNEFHPVGGIHPENCLGIKLVKSQAKWPKFTPAQKAKIKQFGIKLWDQKGKEVNVDNI